MKSIAEPPSEWESPLAAFEAAYKHEQKVTGLINGLVNLAVEEKDDAAKTFLQWFVDEQVEEEESAEAVVNKLKLVADASDGMKMLDDEMGQRVFTPPANKGVQ